MGKRIYLSGPISSDLDGYRAKFGKAAQIVADAGHIPLNPATMPLGLEQRDYMRISIAMLEAADLVLQLDGWDTREGAVAEYCYARKIGVPLQGMGDFIKELEDTADDEEAEPQPETPLSRVERIFGKRETWAEAPKQEPERPATQQEAKQDGKPPIKGFLIIECEDCGETKAFFAKTPVTDQFCSECRHKTPLNYDDLLPAYARCKCGRQFKYRTNARKMNLTVNCINCGAPIDMELNGRGTAFVTIDGVKAGGGR